MNVTAVIPVYNHERAVPAVATGYSRKPHIESRTRVNDRVCSQTSACVM